MLSVLVVDDSTVMRRMVKRCLEMAGLPLGRVLEAENGRTALVQLVSHRVDLVLSDVNMPEMDGVELVRQMSRANVTRGVPVVIVSTERSEPRIEELRSLGVSAYLSKPFRPEELGYVVREVLGVTETP
jgi:two-component system chemotaxis response regulator CheY